MSNHPPNKSQIRARQRLARISHHFLSEPEPTPTQEKQLDVNNLGLNTRNENTRSFIFFILEQDEAPFPTLLLATLLAQFGLRCEVHYPEQKTINIQAQISAPLAYSTAKNTSGNNVTTVQLYTGQHTQSLPTKTPYTLILPTQATPQGLRRSFIQLKHHRHQKMLRYTGITMTGTDDPKLAEQYFAALQQSCLRFLEADIHQNLRSYGLLHRQQQQFSPELEGIAQLIFTDCMPPPKTLHAASPDEIKKSAYQ